MRSGLLRSVVAAAVGSLLFAAGASANTITVTSTADPTGTAGTCTLRDAITAANTNAATNNCAAGDPTTSNPDTINFALPGSPPHTIQLASALPALDDVLTIDGPGSGSLTVRGQGVNNYPVFHVQEGGTAPFPDVTLEGMTITNGARGIFVEAATNFALDDVIVSGNSVASTSATQSSASGAGIESTGGAAMSISNSTVSGNSATATTTGAGTCCSVFAQASGAGIHLGQGGTLNINRSTISGNTASANGNQTAQAIGGGIFNDFGPTTITRSTISGNTATATVSELGGDGSAFADGGAIHQQGANLGLSLDGATVTGNTAATVTTSITGNGFGSAVGGGIDLVWTVAGGLTGEVKGSTIASNTVSETGPGTNFLRGANVDLNVADLLGPEFTFQNTIIANGIGATNCATENDARFGSLGYNLDTGALGNSTSTDSCLQGGATGDQASVSNTNLALGPLQDNGGPTQTMAPGINSFAVDKGTAAGDPTDQRGLARTFDMNPSNADDGTDVGAFEQTILSGPDTSHDFGSQKWGTSTASAVSLLNRTGNSLTPGALAFSGANPGDFLLSSDTCSNTALVNNFSCTANAVFHPISAGNGPRSATLSFPTNVAPTGSVDSIDFTGAVTEYISLVPSPKDYGSTQVGTPTASTQFTVENAGPGTSGTLAAALTGANASEFGITQDNCTGQTLADDGTCTVSVRFAPSSAGAKAATLNITGTPGGTQSSALTGTATAVPTPPPPPPANTGPTGQRAAALKKCKKKKTATARKKCKKKANNLPV
jgi:CSLREA domain-containing protein